MNALGIDPGKKKTGFCYMEDGIPLHIWCDDVDEGKWLFANTYKAVHNALNRFPETEIVFIEGFMGKDITRELIGAIKAYLELHDIEKFQIMPREAKYALTGSGKATKVQVINKINEIYKMNLKYTTNESDQHLDDKHIADAIMIAHVGLQLYNKPIDV